MKRPLIVFLCFIATLCWGQERKKFVYGATVGGGVAGWYEGPNDDLQPFLLPGRELGNRFVPGYAVGAFGKYYVTSRLGFTVSALYMSGGSKLVNNYRTKLPTTGEAAGFTNESTLRFHFLRTPIALSWDVTKTDVRPFLKMGAAPSWALGGYRNIYDHTILTNETREETKPLRLNSLANRSLRYDWLFYAGIGVEIKQQFFIEANLFTGYPTSYAFAEPSGCPPNADCNYFDKSYHRRTILVTLSYGF